MKLPLLVAGSVTGQTPGNNSTNTPAGISATNNLFLLTDDGSRINWTTEQGVGGHGNKSSTSLSEEKNEEALLDDRFGTESSIMGRNTTTSSATTTNFVNDSLGQPMAGPPVGHSQKRSRDRWQWADTTTPLPLWTTPSGTENTDLISKLMDDGWHLTDRNTADERGSATLLDCRFAGVMCDSTVTLPICIICTFYRGIISHVEMGYALLNFQHFILIHKARQVKPLHA